jgi:diguanylate cyclase (GGDEF)-like protein/PAS domain S-box-containing protein
VILQKTAEQNMGKDFTKQIKHKLAAKAALGSLLFALFVGILNAWHVFDKQFEEANVLQAQLAATVNTSASVAAFVRNEEIASDVITGLLSHPMILAANIQDEHGKTISSASRANEKPATSLSNSKKPKVAGFSTYPLFSPMSKKEIVGHINIQMDADYVREKAWRTAMIQSLVLMAQILTSVFLLMQVVDSFVSRSINWLAKRMRETSAGTSERIEIPRDHMDDEIGSLVHSSNKLLDKVEKNLQAERELRGKVEEMERHYRRIFETTNVGIMVLNQDGDLINSNPALLSRIVGLRLEGLGRLEGVKFIDKIFANPETAWSLIREASISARSVSGDCRLLTEDGSERWAHCIISVVIGEMGQIELIEGVLYDVTERKAAEDRARLQADHDALTGLRNRRGMEAFLEYNLRNATEQNQVVGVLLIDLDGFKGVNDEFGHDAGDLVLKGVADRLQSRIRRSTDVVCRYGGDEFVACMANCGTNVDILKETADALVKLMKEPFDLGDGKFAQIGASVGVARYPHNGQTPMAILAAADEAMYEAKKAGKNSYRVAPDPV